MPKRDCDGAHVDDECKRLGCNNAEQGCTIQYKENLYRLQTERLGFIYAAAENEEEARELCSDAYPDEKITEIATLTNNLLRS